MVHPSWFVRALQDESPAVTRSVASLAPASLRAELLSGLKLLDADLRTDLDPHPEVLNWVWSLWTERIVGGGPVGPADAPIVAVLATMPSRTLARLLTLVGLSKEVCGSVVRESHDTDSPPRTAERLRDLRNRIGPVDSFLTQRADADVSTHGGASVQAVARLGLVTLGRLLSTVDPHRWRWAIQHVPYHIARGLRPHMTLDEPGRHRTELLDWEARILQAARDRLALESDDGGHDDA